MKHKKVIAMILLSIFLLANLVVIDFTKKDKKENETDIIHIDYGPRYTGTRSPGQDLMVMYIISEYEVEYTDVDSVLEILITNIGPEDIIDPIELRVSIGGNPIYEDILRMGLESGLSEKLTLGWDNNFYHDIEDNHEVEAYVDYNDIIMEDDEENNILTEVIPVFNLHSNTGFEEYYFYTGIESKVLNDHGVYTNSIDGNLLISQRDMQIKAYQFDLIIDRIYNSQSNYILGPMGYGWTFNHDLHLEIQGNGDVIIVDRDGTKHDFTKSGTDYISPKGEYHKLVKYLSGDYKLFILDGRTFSFNSTGKIVEIKDKNNNSITYSYNGSKLHYINDSSNLSLTLEYNNNLIKSITDPINRTIKYYYDNNKNLTAVKDPNGKNTTFNYDEDHRIISIKDRVNTSINFTYKLAAQVSGKLGRDRIYEINHTNIDKYNIYTHTYLVFNTTNKNTTGTSTYIEYNSDGNPISIEGQILGGFKEGNYIWINCSLINYTDSSSNTKLYNYDNYGNLLNETDPNGNDIKWEYKITDNNNKYITLLSNKTDKLNNSWNHEYDNNGNLIKITDPTSYIKTLNYSSSGLLINESGPPYKEYEYDSHGNLKKIIYKDNTSKEFSYNTIGWLNNTKDEDGYNISYLYDNNGNLLKKTDPLGYNNSYECDYENRIISETNKWGNKTTYSYDSKTGKIASITDPLNYSTNYKYDNSGNLIEVVNKNDISTYFKYDNLNRLIEEKDCYNYIITYEYDANGNLIKITDKNNALIQYIYDSLNRKVQEIDRLGNSTYFSYDNNSRLISITNARNYSIFYEYDEAGRLINITDPVGNVTTKVYDSTGTLIQKITKDNTTINYTYDVRNRLISITDIIGTTNYSYDNRSNRITITDPLNRTVKYSYDELGRLVNITSPMNHKTTYKYEKCSCSGGMDLVVEIEDALGHSIEYTYDALGRRLTETTELGNVTRFEYDGDGNLINRTDANGNKTLYIYDNLNRLINITYPDNTSINFSYDPMGKIKESHSNGFGAKEDIYYTYDAKGHILKIKLVVNNNTFEINYEYDEIGNKIKVIDPGNGTTSYQYDALNRIIKITNPYNENTTFIYDSMGRLINQSCANGMNLSNTYNKKGWLINQNYTKNDTFLINISYNYDSIGRISNKTDINGTTFYSYDNENKLTQVNYPWGETVTYIYDSVGNRIQMDKMGTIINYNYNNDNQLTSMSDGPGTSYTYDNNGNVIRKSRVGISTNYTYDYENRLVKIAFGDNTTVEYKYFNTGKRFAKIIGNNTTYFFYDKENIILEWNNTYELQAQYTHGPGIDYLISVYTNNLTFYYCRDKLGNIINLINQSGDLKKNYTYDAWGEVIVESGEVNNTFKYTGREYDSESGLYYYRARHYDPKIGRFIQKDPIGMAAGPNYYVYVKNNPINRIDPFGLEDIEGDCYPDDSDMPKDDIDDYDDDPNAPYGADSWVSTGVLCGDVFEDCMAEKWRNQDTCLINARNKRRDCIQGAYQYVADAEKEATSEALYDLLTGGAIKVMIEYGIEQKEISDTLKTKNEKCWDTYRSEKAQCPAYINCKLKEYNCYKKYSLPLHILRGGGGWADDPDWFDTWWEGHTGETP